MAFDNELYKDVSVLTLPDVVPGMATPVSIDQNQVYCLEFKGSKFFCTGCGSLIPGAMYTSLSMEKKIREKWWNIKPDDYVLDLGSHFGSYTLTALALGAGLVVAIDPDRISYFDLETNLVLNMFHRRCLHLNIMIGNNVGMCDYYPYSHSNRKEGDQIETRLMSTIDKIVSVFALPKLDWVKIDVEGMEMDVLEGSKETLERFKPKLLIENHECFEPGITDKIKSFLTPFGYTEERDTSEYGCWSFWENKHGN